MHLALQQVNSLDEQSLLEFVELELAEDTYLDYKQAWTSKSDDDAKRELLKDVTGFANSAGGHILIGVRDPKSGGSATERMKGVQDGGKLAIWIERVISHCIDPRIAGVQVKLVPLSSGAGCVVIHVPSSFGRPHMVSMDGPQTFHIRHTESTVPMSAHEIREAVLTSASTEDRAREAARRQLVRATQKMSAGKGYFFLQAIPLLTRPERLDVLGKEIETILMDESRYTKFKHISLVCEKPKPTIDGVRASCEHRLSAATIEIGRNGHVSATVEIKQKGFKGGADGNPVFYSSTTEVFFAFAKVLDDLIRVSGSDVPYLMAASYFGASRTFLITNVNYFEQEFKHEEDAIEWPEHVRSVGQSASEVASEQAQELFYAFGQRYIP